MKAKAKAKAKPKAKPRAPRRKKPVLERVYAKLMAEGDTHMALQVADIRARLNALDVTANQALLLLLGLQAGDFIRLPYMGTPSLDATIARLRAVTDQEQKPAEVR